jgi:hypothetical protein
VAALRKAKDERFVHLVADGKSGVDAYLEAGHKVNHGRFPVWRSGSRFPSRGWQKPHV